MGLCLSASAQTTPLEAPERTSYPGMIQTFEKLIQIDGAKFTKRLSDLTRVGRVLEGAEKVSSLELEPDFLNSIVLHSDPGYLRLASTHKCRFYETILTDLLRDHEGKIKNVLMTYVEKDVRQSAVVSKKDFLTKVVNQECPETQGMIAQFQIKTLDQTLKNTNFEIPTGVDQCRNIHVNWVNNPKTPFLCQIHEYMKEVKTGGGDPKDLSQRRAIARILNDKLTLVQKDYLENLCGHLDDEEAFCDEFLNVSFWTKVAAGYEDKIYAEDICRQVVNSSLLSETQYSACLSRLKKEKDLCLYPGGRNSSLVPQPDCDQLSLALNHSSLKASFKDCPGNSDQLVITNMGRILSHFMGDMPIFEGPCSASSAGRTYVFNRDFNNDENWGLEACYDDQLAEREVCAKTFFGKFGNEPESYGNVVAGILKKTRGADQSLTCEMVDSEDYNPLLLRFKAGCFVIYEREKCFISRCEHKILYNDRKIDFIKLKNQATLAYFPTSVREERFSQHYLLTRDYKKNGRTMNNLSSIKTYWKSHGNGIIHGVGCAEELLPSFFKAQTINQCTPLPFILSGMLTDKDRVVFVTRTAVDSLQAPRLVSWSSVFSAVKTYQRTHPLKLWTMYALD
jgi:hypothetical protein